MRHKMMVVLSIVCLALFYQNCSGGPLGFPELRGLDDSVPSGSSGPQANGAGAVSVISFVEFNSGKKFRYDSQGRVSVSHPGAYSGSRFFGNLSPELAKELKEGAGALASLPSEVWNEFQVCTPEQTRPPEYMMKIRLETAARTVPIYEETGCTARQLVLGDLQNLYERTLILLLMASNSEFDGLFDFYLASHTAEPPLLTDGPDVELWRYTVDGADGSKQISILKNGKVQTTTGGETVTLAQLDPRFLALLDFYATAYTPGPLEVVTVGETVPEDAPMIKLSQILPSGEPSPIYQQQDQNVWHGGTVSQPGDDARERLVRLFSYLNQL